MVSRTRSAAVREFRAMNTEWWVSVPGCEDPSLYAAASAIVHSAEEAYSRFRPGSLLSRLNRERRLADASLADIVRRALAMNVATGGAFDARVGPALVAAGYGVSFEQLPARRPDTTLRLAPPVDLLHVEVEGDEVRLEGMGALDLGGIAKGWTIDQVAQAIESHGYRDYVIDGGGDIRTRGHGSDGEPWPIGVGEALVAHLSGEAVCTSSTARRRWPTPRGEAHHLIDPRTGTPSFSVVANVAVIAPDTTTADALATAVVADPARALPAVTAAGGGALLEHGGRWVMTPGTERWIR
jgi:FAD:protein FMN transferase